MKKNGYKNNNVKNKIWNYYNFLPIRLWRLTEFRSRDVAYSDEHIVSSGCGDCAADKGGGKPVDNGGVKRIVVVAVEQAGST